MVAVQAVAVVAEVLRMPPARRRRSAARRPPRRAPEALTPRSSNGSLAASRAASVHALRSYCAPSSRPRARILPRERPRSDSSSPRLLRRTTTRLTDFERAMRTAGATAEATITQRCAFRRSSCASRSFRDPRSQQEQPGRRGSSAHGRQSPLRHPAHVDQPGIHALGAVLPQRRLVDAAGSVELDRPDGLRESSLSSGRNRDGSTRHPGAESCGANEE